MSTPDKLRPEDEKNRGSKGTRRESGRAELPPTYPGSELLYGDRPKTVLHRLNDGDPLGLRQRGRERIQMRAVLISENRLYLRSLARVAYASMKYRGDPPLGTWLSDRIDQSLEELLNEDRFANWGREEEEEDPEERYKFLTKVLGVSPTVARRASVVFNILPDAVRVAFWALVIEGKSLNRHVAEGHGTPDDVRARVKRAILTISQLKDPGEVPPPKENP